MRTSLLYRVLMSAAVAGLITEQGARGDFTLHGTEHLLVSGEHESGYLYEESSATISGNVQRLYAHDASLAQIDGGTLYALECTGTSTADFAAGESYYVNVKEDSFFKMSGGSVNSLSASGGSRSLIEGGQVDWLGLTDVSSVTLRGGETRRILAWSESQLSILGGQVAQVLALGTSLVRISDVTPADGIWAQEESTVVLELGSVSVTGGMTLSDQRIIGAGYISGTWLDGTPFETRIYQNDPSARVFVPEPMAHTMMLAALGWALRGRAGRAGVWNGDCAKQPARGG